MVTPVQTAILAGLGLGAVHYLAHRTFGSEMSFAEAGVNGAGIAVTVGGIVATYLILTLAGVAG